MPEGKDLKPILTRQVKRHKDEAREIMLFKRPVEPYIVKVDIAKEIYDVTVHSN